MFRSLFVFQLVFSFILTSCFATEDIRELSRAMAVAQNGSIHEIVLNAREYRTNPAVPLEKEEERQQKLLQEVYYHLVSYQEEDSLENAIKAFLTDILGMDALDFSVVDAGQTDLGGKSHDPVFMVKDLEGRLCYIVKAFCNPRQLSSKFLPEISALDFIKELALPSVGAIEPLAVASYREGSNEWGLLLESVAKGKRMDQYILELGQQELGSEQRQNHLQVAQSAFIRMGQSLAELHAIKSPQPGSLPLSDFQKYDDKLMQVMDDSFIVKELAEHLSISDFYNYVQEIKDQCLQVPIFYTYWHGDAHLGNLFYDQEQDVFYFIDVAKMHRSIAAQEQPLLDGTIDLLRVEENFRRKALDLLTEEEVNLLLTSFYQAYEDQAGQLPDERLLAFHKTYVKLGRLIRYSRYVEEKDPEQQASDRKVFESAVDYFKNQIVKVALDFNV